MRLGHFCCSPEGSGYRVNFNSNTNFLVRGNTQKQRSGTEENKRILEERMFSLDSVSESTGLSTSIVKALRTGLRFEPCSPEGETEFAVGLAGTACLLTQMTTKTKSFIMNYACRSNLGHCLFFVNHFFVCVEHSCAHSYMNCQKI